MIWPLLVTCLLTYILLLCSTFEIFWTTLFVPSVETTQGLSQPPAKRVVLIVMDGVRADTFWLALERNNGQVAFAQRHGGIYGECISSMPTITKPCILAITSGAQSNYLLEIICNIFHRQERFPTLFDYASVSLYFGYSDILQIFQRPNGSDPFFAKKLVSWRQGMRHLTCDKPLVDAFESLFNQSLKNSTLSKILRSEKMAIYFHFSNTDFSGHFYGPLHDKTIKNIKKSLDRIDGISSFLQNYYGDNKTAFVVCSDHGMTSEGKHGGGSRSELIAPIVTWGPGINSRRKKIFIRQTDIAPYISTLIGLPVPPNSIGHLRLEMFELAPLQRAQALAANAFQVSTLATAAYIKLPTVFNIMFSSKDHIQNLKKDITNCILKGLYSKAEKLSMKLLDVASKSFQKYERFFKLSFVMWHLLILSGWTIVCFENGSSTQKNKQSKIQKERSDHYIETKGENNQNNDNDLNSADIQSNPNSSPKHVDAIVTMKIPSQQICEENETTAETKENANNDTCISRSKYEYFTKSTVVSESTKKISFGIIIKCLLKNLPAIILEIIGSVIIFWMDLPLQNFVYMTCVIILWQYNYLNFFKQIKSYNWSQLKEKGFFLLVMCITAEFLYNAFLGSVQIGLAAGIFALVPIFFKWKVNKSFITMWYLGLSGLAFLSHEARTLGPAGARLPLYAGGATYIGISITLLVTSRVRLSDTLTAAALAIIQSLALGLQLVADELTGWGTSNGKKVTQFPTMLKIALDSLLWGSLLANIVLQKRLQQLPPASYIFLNLSLLSIPVIILSTGFELLALLCLTSVSIVWINLDFQKPEKLCEMWRPILFCFLATTTYLACGNIASLTSFSIDWTRNVVRQLHVVHIATLVFIKFICIFSTIVGPFLIVNKVQGADLKRTISIVFCILNFMAIRSCQKMILNQPFMRKNNFLETSEEPFAYIRNYCCILLFIIFIDVSFIVNLYLNRMYKYNNV